MHSPRWHHCRTVRKPCIDSVPPTMQSQFSKSRERPFIVYVDTLCVLLNIFIDQAKRSIHFYWIHFWNKILTWQMSECIYDIVCLKWALKLGIPLLMKCWPKQMALKTHISPSYVTRIPYFHIVRDWLIY